MKKIIPYLLSLVLLIMLIITILLYRNEVNELNTKVDKCKTETKTDNKSETDTSNKTIIKECTYVRTYEFKDYYNYTQLSDNNYYVVLDTYLSKNGPVIESLTTDLFPKEFVKGNNYEITYHSEIRYNEENNIISESKEIVSVKKTDKTGMEQEQSACILK